MNEKLSELRSEDASRTEADLAFAIQEIERLRSVVCSLEAERRRLSQAFVEEERRKLALASLYVAGHRLHQHLQRLEVLAVIREILKDLVGTEEFAVFELDHGSGRMRLIDSMGVDLPTDGAVPLAHCLVARAGSAEHLVGGTSSHRCWPGAPATTACVPLTVEGRVIGVVVIFGLLQQKPGLEPIDHELLELLGTHAATALYATFLHERASGVAGHT